MRKPALVVLMALLLVLDRAGAVYAARCAAVGCPASGPESVPAQRVTARPLVEDAELSRSYEGQELPVEPEGDRVVLIGSLQGFDGTLQVEALASVEVVEGELVVTAEEVAFGEDGTRQELTQDVRDELNLRVPVGDLPYELMLTAAEVHPDGMALRAEGPTSS